MTVHIKSGNGEIWLNDVMNMLKKSSWRIAKTYQHSFYRICILFCQRGTWTLDSDSTRCVDACGSNHLHRALWAFVAPAIQVCEWPCCTPPGNSIPAILCACLGPSGVERPREPGALVSEAKRRQNKEWNGFVVPPMVTLLDKRIAVISVPRQKYTLKYNNKFLHVDNVVIIHSWCLAAGHVCSYICEEKKDNICIYLEIW